MANNSQMGQSSGFHYRTPALDRNTTHVEDAQRRHEFEKKILPQIDGTDHPFLKSLTQFWVNSDLGVYPRAERLDRLDAQMAEQGITGKQNSDGTWNDGNPITGKQMYSPQMYTPSTMEQQGLGGKTLNDAMSENQMNQDLTNTMSDDDLLNRRQS